MCPGGVRENYLQWFESEFRGYVLRSTPRIPQPAPVHPPPAAPVDPPPAAPVPPPPAAPVPQPPAAPVDPAPVHQDPPASPSLFEELQALMARGERPDLESDFVQLLRRRRYIL